MGRNILFPGMKDGETFEMAGIEFIKFPDENGVTPVVTRNIQLFSRFGDNNDLTCSAVLRRMQEEFLPKIMEALGEETLCEIRTDLTTMDGLKPYPDLVSMVSLPTMEFYRKHVNIFDRYKLDRWWWLATPESAAPHDDPDWVLCVAPSGFINYDICISDGHGVRPFLALKSSIFGSCED